VNQKLATGVWLSEVALRARTGWGEMDALAAGAVPNLFCRRPTQLSARVEAHPQQAKGAGDGAAAVWNGAGVVGSAVSVDDSPFTRPRSLAREPGALEAQLEQEFEQRLADCPTLAFRVGLGVLRNRAEAEDVAQEAMLRAYRNFHRLRDRDRFRAWLVRTAWRLALDRIRSAGRRERRERAVMEDCAGETAVENVVATREFERHLAAALDQLPEKLRMAIVLAAIEGYNMREMATLLEIPEGTVKSRLHLARKQLADALRAAGVAPAQQLPNESCE
jgi:RNA polymerase sigma-70 factor, ECF subfamily